MKIKVFLLFKSFESQDCLRRKSKIVYMKILEQLILKSYVAKMQQADAAWLAATTHDQISLNFKEK